MEKEHRKRLNDLNEALGFYRKQGKRINAIERALGQMDRTLDELEKQGQQ